MMAAIATKTPARIWLILLGAVLLLIAVLGLIGPVVSTMKDLTINLDGGEDIAHWVLGILTLIVAFTVKDDATLTGITIVYGVIYVLIGIYGFFMPDTAGVWMLGLGDNILHLAVGAVTIGAGLASRGKGTAAMRTV